MAETLLRKKKETSVCVFEKEDRFGGRIFDYWFPQAPDITVGKVPLRSIHSKFCLTLTLTETFKQHL